MSDHKEPNKEIDQATGVETTGHEWDGLKELNNPLPRWWVWILVASIVWSIGYWIMMPAWPLVSSYTEGRWNQSDRSDVDAAVAALQAARAENGARLAQSTPEEIRADEGLLEFALAAGDVAFADNCATCHGRGGQGTVGYPSLADDVWLWGGTLDDIYTTLQYGIRSEHDQTRFSQMPAFLRDEMLSEGQVSDMVEYVVSLGGREANADAVARSAEEFEFQCAYCHGAEAQGDQMMGAPNLTDREWLYGSTREAIHTSISNARFGVMPAWGDRLDPVTLRALAVYVHSLGGGEEADNASN